MFGKQQYQMQRLTYVVILVVLSLLIVSPFIIPIALAATIAFLLYPYHYRLLKRSWSKSKSAFILTLLFTTIISIPFMFFLSKGTLLVVDLLESFSPGEKIQNQGIENVVATLRDTVLIKIDIYSRKLGVSQFLTKERLTTYLQAINSYLLDLFRKMASSISSMILFFIVMILSIFSFLKYSDGIRIFFQNLFGFSNRKMDQLIGIFLRDARQIYLANVLTGATQSILVASSVYIVTGTDWFLIFFITLITSFIPIVGAAPMAFLFSLITLFQGNTVGAIVLAVLASVAGIIDNFMRPWLASFGESKTPALLSFVFVVGSTLWFGLPGLFIGLMMGAVVYDTVPLFWEEIFKTPPVAKGMSRILGVKKAQRPEDMARH